MPVLFFDDTPRRFILPSTQDKPGDQQGWVEMATYPLCADDYAVYYSKMYNLVAGQPKPSLNAEILARRIRSWNYTDQTGAPLEITGEIIGHLDLSDVGFLINKIEDEPQEELTEDLKDSSLPTSSPSPTDSQ